MTTEKTTHGLQFDPDMPEEAVNILRSHGVRRSYSKKQMVVTIGDDFPNLFIIESGRFSISVIDEDGKASIYGYLAKGSTWGLKAALTDQPATLFFESLEESEVICVDRKTLWSLIDENPIVRRGVIFSLGWSITKATMFGHYERTRSLKMRLVNFLVENASEDLTIELSQSVMARNLGASRNALGVHLQTLKHLGLIEIEYGRVRLLDMDALRRMGEGPGDIPGIAK